jgi:zinc finger protein
MAGDRSTLPFTLILDDPAGNSYVENPKAPSLDPRLRVTFYDRTATQVREGGREGRGGMAAVSFMLLLVKSLTSSSLPPFLL